MTTSAMVADHVFRITANLVLEVTAVNDRDALSIQELQPVVADVPLSYASCGISGRFHQDTFSTQHHH